MSLFPPEQVSPVHGTSDCGTRRWFRDALSLLPARLSEFCQYPSKTAVDAGNIDHPAATAGAAGFKASDTASVDFHPTAARLAALATEFDGTHAPVHERHAVPANFLERVTSGGSQNLAAPKGACSPSSFSHDCSLSSG